MGLGSWLYKSLGFAPGGDIPYSYGSGTTWGLYSGWSNLLPSTRIDYRVEAGDLLQNSAVMACINWICRTFPEAPIQVVQKKRSGDDAVYNHPLTQLLRTPNPFYNGLLLWQATICSYDVAGNAFWLKVRNGSGQVKEIWYEPHLTCRAVWPDDGSEFISGYQVMRRGQWSNVIPRSEVVHFRNGIDPNNPRNGLAPLAAALKEVFTDNEASTFSAALLRNMGVPGLVISPADSTGGPVVIEDPEGLKREIISKFSGDKRGEPLIMTGPTKAEMIGFTPESMNLEALRNIPEERISALLGLPAMIAGLGAGYDASTLANYSAAREAAYHNCILPMQRVLAAELDGSLLPDLGDPAHERVDFDTSAVAALSEDRNDLYARVTLAYKSGVIKRSEARTALDEGYDSDDDDAHYVNEFPGLQERLAVDLAEPTTLVTPGTGGTVPVAAPALPAPNGAGTPAVPGVGGTHGQR